MSTRFRLFRILLPLLALWLASCELSSQSGGTSDDTHSSIAVSGRVLTQESKPLSAVVVHLRKANLSDTTDGEGRFVLVGDTLPASNSATSTLDTLDYLRDGILVHSAPVHAWIETMPDVYLVQRDISGALAEIPSPSGYVIAKIWNSRGDSISIDLDLNTATKRFSGFAWFRSTGGLDSFRIQILATDAKERPIGQSQELSFTSRAGDLQIPDFDPNNLRPRITFAVPSNGRRRATIDLHAEVKNLTGWGIQYEWSIGSGSWKKGRTDTAFAIPDNVSDLLAVRVRAMRSDSLSTTDSVVIDIVSTGPQAWIATSASTVKAGGTLGVHLADSTAGASIIRRRIGAPWNVDVSGTDTTLTFPSDSGTIPVWYCVTDNLGDSACTYVLVRVMPPETIDPRSNAITLYADESVKTKTLTAEKTLWYKFHVDSGTSYTVQQNCPNAPCPNFSTFRFFRDSSRTEFDSITGGTFNFAAPKSGTIYFSVTGYSIQDGVTRSSFGYWDSVNFSVYLKSSTPQSSVVPLDAIALLQPDGPAYSAALPCNQFVWFKFPAKAGVSYDILQLNHYPVPNSPNWHLLNAYRGKPTGPDSSGNRRHIVSQKDDTILVSFIGNSSDVSVKAVQVALKVVQSNPAPSSAKPLTLDSSLTTFQVVRDPDYNDKSTSRKVWFSFQADSGTTYHFELSGPPDTRFSAGYSFYYDTLADMFSGFGVNNIYSYGLTTDFIAPKSGKVFVAFGTDYSYSAPSNPPFQTTESATFSLRAWSNRSQVQAGTSKESATLLATDGLIGFAYYNRDPQWFKFPVLKNHFYLLDKSCRNYPGSGDRCQIQFSNSSGDPVNPSVGNLGYEYLATKDDMIYVVLTLPYLHGMVSPAKQYFSVLDRTDIHNETMSTATELSTSSPAIQKTISDLTQNWFRFHADSGKAYAISHTTDSANSLITSFWSIDSAKLTESVARPSAARSEFVCLKSGTYFYKVADTSTFVDDWVHGNAHGTSILHYSTVLAQLDRIPTWFSGLDDYEPDSTMGMASTIIVDADPVSHTLTRSDVDWIQFQATSGNAYTIALSSSDDCSLSVFDSDSIEHPIGDAYLGARLFIPNASSKFWIRVSSNSDSAKYSLKVATLPDDIYERDETRETAKEIATNGDSQTRTLSGTPDLIKFRVQAAKKYWVRIVNNTTHCIEANTLLDGLSGSTSGNGCIWGTKYLPATAIADTVAYLKVFDKDPTESAAYSISITPEFVDSFESDNTLSSAKPILTGGLFQYRSIATGDQDWISFEVDSGATYRIDATSAWNSEAINMDLFSADSAQLGNQVSSPAPVMIVTGRRTTTYFIRISTPAPTSSSPNLPTSFNYVIDVQKQ